jgi:hypothetical protein
MKAVGVETGGSNVQLAIDRDRPDPHRRDEPARLALGAREQGDRV